MMRINDDVKNVISISSRICYAVTGAPPETNCHLVIINFDSASNAWCLTSSSARFRNPITKALTPILFKTALPCGWTAANSPRSKSATARVMSSLFSFCSKSASALITEKLLALDEESRADLGKIKATAKRVVIIEKLANAEISSHIYASDLVDIGLFEKSDPNRSSITALLRKLPATEIDTFEEVQGAILREKLLIKERKDQLARLKDRLNKKVIL